LARADNNQDWVNLVEFLKAFKPSAPLFKVKTQGRIPEKAEE
jgi:hypothetical protein